MVRSLLKLAGLMMLLVVTSAGVIYYQFSTSATRKIEQLQDEKRQLEQFVTRLATEKRVADILVSHQNKTAQGQLETTLLFVEYNKQGNPLPAKSFSVSGDYVHIDAMVIAFDRGLVRDNDALRGHSIALFTKIYGDQQKPADAALIDPPGAIPDIYRDADPRVSEFEMSLWKDFWKLYDDENYRKEKGVRSSDGHGLWGIFKPDRLYTITITPEGKLTLTSEPLKGIYREALKQNSPPA